MNTILNKHTLILGSGSPRRSQLLKEMDIPYTVLCLDTEESYPQELPAEEVAEYLAIKKSTPYLSRLSPNEIVLTADSVVINDGKILGKPKDKDEAIDMISEMAGGTHKVITGYCIRSTEKQLSNAVTALVRMRPMDRNEITYYVDKYQPMDKAGSYGIQEWIGHVAIESIQGTFTNIMGLPTYEVYRDLVSFCNKLTINKDKIDPFLGSQTEQ